MKRFSMLFLLASIANVCCMLISCDHGPVADQGSTDEDFVSRKAYYASSKLDLSSFTLESVDEAASGAFVASQDSDDVPDIFVVKCSDLASLGEDDVILAIKTCLAGKAIVMDQPKIEQIKAFWDRITALLEDKGGEGEEYEFLKAEHEISGWTIHDIISTYGLDESYTESSNEHVYEVIGLCKGQAYYVHDMDEIVDADSGHVYKGTGTRAGKEHVYEVYDENGNKLTDVNETESGEETTENVSDTGLPKNLDDVISRNVELFSAWLKQQGYSGNDSAERAAVMRMLPKDAQGDLDNIVKAQTVTTTYTVSFSNPRSNYYDGRMDGKSEVVQTTLSVWTACDIAKQEEYFLVRTSLLFNNQQLGYNNGFRYDSQEGYVGPYFNSAAVSVKLPGGELKANDCKPENGVGTTNFTAGSSFNIGGNVGLTPAGLSGGVTAGVSVSQSTTRSIPDVGITFIPDTVNAIAAWKYNTPEVTLRKDENYFWNGHFHCNDPKSIQINAGAFDTYSLFKRSSAYDQGNRIAHFETNLTTELGVSVGHDTYSAGLYRGPALARFYHSRWVLHHIPFSRPNNLAGNYIMAFEAPSGASAERIGLYNNVLKEYFPDWGSSAMFFAFGDASNKISALDNVAKSAFALVKKKISGNKNVLKDRGFAGKFRFYIQNVENSTQISSFELDFQ